MVQGWVYLDEVRAGRRQVVGAIESPFAVPLANIGGLCIIRSAFAVNRHTVPHE